MKSHTEALARQGLTMNQVRNNIRAYLNHASPEDINAGIGWYEDAMSLGEWMAKTCHVSLDHAAVAIAHLSPRTRWSENVRLAKDLAETGDAFGTIRGHVTRAKAALAADDPWSTFGKAPKTRSFAANIRGDLSAVTVDVWASRIAGVSEQQLGRVGVYEAIAHAYRLEARRAGILPAQLQAITWIVIRGAAK
jgi:hypothetical protein